MQGRSVWIICSFLTWLSQCSVAANEHDLVIGMLLGVTKKTYQYFLAFVAFDIDFRKNFNATLREQFGPPIVEIPDLPPNLRITSYLVNTDGQHDIGIVGALDLVMGRNGYKRANGLIGAHYSTLSKPIASIGAALQQPQVSPGSTSTDLSNKQVYPFFLRTVPPDNLQARAVWRHVRFFNITTCGVVYSAESYGVSIHTVIVDLARSYGKSKTVESVALAYMPKDFDTVQAQGTLDSIKLIRSKLVIIAISSAILGEFIFAMHGQLGPLYQLLFTESVFAFGQLKAYIPIGSHAVRPASKGAKYRSFWDLWKRLTPSYYTDPDNLARWRINAWNPSGGLFDVSNIDQEWFEREELLDFYMLFFFDACYAFAHAFAKMVATNRTSDEIHGHALLDTLKKTEFQGVTGAVSFDSKGDRRGDYHFVILKPISGSCVPPGLPSKLVNETSWITAGTYRAAENEFSLDSPEAGLFWTDCSSSVKAPVHLTFCDVGFYSDGHGDCRQCPTGTYADVSGMTMCAQCPLGHLSNDLRIGCVACGPGSYASSSDDAARCSPCASGHYSSLDGASTCDECFIGRFASKSGRSQCENCGPGSYASWRAASSCSTCASGHYSSLEGASTCVECPYGRFASESGRTQCENCISLVPGATTQKTGANYPDDCLRCEPGRSSDGSHPCDACNIGRFADHSGATACEDCSIGKTTHSHGSDSCTYQSGYLAVCISISVLSAFSLVLALHGVKRFLRIEDVSLREQTLTLKTLRRHWILWAGNNGLPATLKGTMHNELEGRFRVKPLGPKHLEVLAEDGKSLGRADASHGVVLIHCWVHLFFSGWFMPNGVWIILLMTVNVSLALGLPLGIIDWLLAMAGGSGIALIVSASLKFFGRARQTPLQEALARFEDILASKTKLVRPRLDRARRLTGSLLKALIRNSNDRNSNDEGSPSAIGKGLPSAADIRKDEDVFTASLQMWCENSRQISSCLSHSTSYNAAGAVPRGGSRSVTFGQVFDLWDFFQTFIRDRTMYYLSANIIRYLTGNPQHSYAEIVGSFNIDYFVSHFWGHEFRKFVKALHEHADSVVIPMRVNSCRYVRYWICTLCNNQWKINDELGGAWEQSSFYQAMRSETCIGTVMVIDESLKPLHRSWCLFELVQTFQLRRERPEFTGLTLTTDRGVLNSGKAPVDIVLQIAQAVKGLRLEDASASVQDDKDMIDKFILQNGGFLIMNAFICESVKESLLSAQLYLESEISGVVSALASKSEPMQQHATASEPMISLETAHDRDPTTRASAASEHTIILAPANDPAVTVISSATANGNDYLIL